MSSNPKPRWKLSTISNITLLILYLLGAVALVVLVNVKTKQQAPFSRERAHLSD